MRNGNRKGIPAKNLAKDWAEYFALQKRLFGEADGEAGLCTAGEGFLAFGDNLYRMPERMPGVKGAESAASRTAPGNLEKESFRTGSCAGTGAVPEGCEACMESVRGEAAAYLKGQTFSAEGEKGWYLICVDDISLGWGKLAGGIMKNHYPKGLRK